MRPLTPRRILGICALLFGVWFVCVVISTKDLSASIWMWKRDNGSWSATKDTK